MEPAAVLVPVKDFRQAKVRLTPALEPGERAALARAMASVVVCAAAPLPVWVVCDDREVAIWAEEAGASVLWRPGRGLNPAVTEGVATLGTLGFDRVVVAHADLPRAAGLAALIEQPEAVVIVPDRRRDGSNVLVVPPEAGFRFRYGAGSFARHLAEAARLGLPVRVLQDERLSWDVDLPDDLAGLLDDAGLAWSCPPRP